VAAAMAAQTVQTAGAASPPAGTGAPAPVDKPPPHVPPG
jgi:hypothetical protein